MASFDSHYNLSPTNSTMQPAQHDSMSQAEFWALFEQQEGEQAHSSPFTHGMQEAKGEQGHSSPSLHEWAVYERKLFPAITVVQQGVIMPAELGDAGLVETLSTNDQTVIGIWCPTCGKTFGRQSDRERHVRTTHLLEETYWCPVPVCKRAETDGNKPFPRKDKRDEHVRKVHKVKM